MTKDEDILKEEVGLILEDIRTAYRNSGKKVSGEFEKGLEAKFSGKKAIISGFVYLAGRGRTRSSKKGDPTLTETILQWIKDRNIKPREEGLSLKALAFLIARKIHREGTDDKRHFRIYESVITPERILSVIERFETINANRIITEITAELRILAKNV